MTLVLADAGLLVPDDLQDYDFWVRLAGWGVDNRIQLGPSVFDLCIEFFNDHGYPASFDFIPVEIRMDANRVLQKLITRVYLPASPGGHLDEFVPAYQGLETFGIALMMDVMDAIDAPVDGIAHYNAWEQATTSVECKACGISLDLVCDPNHPTQADIHASAECATQESRSFFRDKSVLIFGAKRSELVVSELKRTCEPAELTWYETEPKKHIRDIERKLSRRTAGQDIVVMVTGFISHSESGSVKSNCASVGLDLLEVERPNEIPGALEEFFKSKSSA